jgi:hypothetical protein
MKRKRDDGTDDLRKFWDKLNKKQRNIALLNAGFSFTKDLISCKGYELPYMTCEALAGKSCSKIKTCEKVR